MHTLNNLRGAIFDLDGTLFDSMGVWMEVDKQFLKKRKLVMPDDYHNEVKCRNFPEAARYTKNRFALTESEEEIMREWSQMTAHSYENEVVLKAYAKDYLTKLKHEGIKLGIATSSKAELYMPVLKRSGIESYFDAVVTTEQTKPKNFPDVYLEAARLLGVSPEECAVFEDIAVGVKSAKEAGFYTVAVHDIASASEERALRAQADRYIQTFRELL